MYLITQEHYYDPESGSGYLAWRLKTIQRKTAEEKGASASKSPKSKYTYQMLMNCVGRINKIVFLLKVVGQAVVNPDPSLLTNCCLMRMWKQLLLF